MCASDRVSELDRLEAFELGSAAVRLAVNGTTGVMTALKRISNNPYRVELSSTPLADVAVRAKPIPDSMFTSSGFMVNRKYLDYVRPLVGKLPEYARIEKVLVKKGTKYWHTQSRKNLKPDTTVLLTKIQVRQL
jgi:6-phosphofructokinase 1